MEPNEIIENSEEIKNAVEETVGDAVEELAIDSGSIAVIGAIFGVGVLAGVVTCTRIVPGIKNKIKSFRKKYVKFPVKDEREQGRPENEEMTPPDDEDEEPEEKNSKK